MTDRPPEKNPTVHGWVPQTRLITNREAYRAPESAILVKCVVVNTRSFLAKPAAGEAPSKLSPARVRLAPDANGRDAGNLRFFS